MILKRQSGAKNTKLFLARSESPAIAITQVIARTVRTLPILEVPRSQDLFIVVRFADEGDNGNSENKFYSCKSAHCLDFDRLGQETIKWRKIPAQTAECRS